MPNSIEPIPDQSHINKVRDALSIRPISRASVMIGAGFSRNAQKTQFDAPDMPFWADIAEELSNQLYPESASRGTYGGRVLAPSVDNVLRLAQEYEVALDGATCIVSSNSSFDIRSLCPERHISGY